MDVWMERASLVGLEFRVMEVLEPGAWRIGHDEMGLHNFPSDCQPLTPSEYFSSVKKPLDYGEIV